jgi:hypothetical protein
MVTVSGLQPDKLVVEILKSGAGNTATDWVVVSWQAPLE